MRQRLDRVDIGGETARRLRFADADDQLRLQPAERIDAGRVPHRLARLREDVIRERVAGDGAAGGRIKTGIARRVERLERVDADLLRRDADPGIAVAEDVLPVEE